MALLKQNDAFGWVLVPVAVIVAGTLGARAQDNTAVATAPQAALPVGIAPLQGTNWRNEIGTFKIGLVRGWSSDMSKVALARVEAVFAKALGTPVKIVVFERFTSLIDAHADGRIDLAGYSARAYATVRLMCECVEAIATPTMPDGATGQVAVLAGDPTRLSSLSAIGPAKIGRVASAQIATGEMLRGTLTINGKSVTGGEDYWVDFPDYRSAIQAYQQNEIDGMIIPAATDFANQTSAGATGLETLTKGQTGQSLRNAKALWRSPFWPYGPIAVKSTIAAEAKEIVLKTLEQIDVTAPAPHAVLSEGLAGPFRAADQRGYANITMSIRLLVGQNAKWR